MEREFVPFKLSVKLKELGFDEPCFRFYFNNELLNKYCNKTYRNTLCNPLKLHKFKATAPLWQQAFDWFREEKGLSSCIIFNGSEQYYWWITETSLFGVDINSIDDNVFLTYEEAREQCLIKLIEL